MCSLANEAVNLRLLCTEHKAKTRRRVEERNIDGIRRVLVDLQGTEGLRDTWTSSGVDFTADFVTIWMLLNVILFISQAIGEEKIAISWRETSCSDGFHESD